MLGGEGALEGNRAMSILAEPSTNGKYVTTTTFAHKVTEVALQSDLPQI